MKATSCYGVALLLIGSAIFASAKVKASTESQDSSASAKSQVFELPQSSGGGEGKEVTVLLDEGHLKLATVALRGGTRLPTHSTPVPATILVLEGVGVIHVGSEAVPVAKGTIVSLAAGVEHDVVPASGSDMLLLVHYVRGAPGSPPPDVHQHR